MNDLILTCNTGGGHNSAAYAMQEYITSQSDNAVTLDFMKLKSERASRIVGGALYQYGEKYTESVWLCL